LLLDSNYSHHPLIEIFINRFDDLLFKNQLVPIWALALALLFGFNRSPKSDPTKTGVAQLTMLVNYIERHPGAGIQIPKSPKLTKLGYKAAVNDANIGGTMPANDCALHWRHQHESAK